MPPRPRLSLIVWIGGPGSTPAATCSPLNDRHNTVMALADASGTVVETCEYDAGGNPTVCDASGLNFQMDNLKSATATFLRGWKVVEAGMVADVGLQVFSLASRPAVRAVLQTCLDRFGMMPEELRRLPKSAPVKMLIASLL